MKQGHCILFSLFFLLHTSAWSKIITVGEGTEYHSIKIAIQNAQPGDTIQVVEGLYKEKNIVVDKPLFLQGINFPILDGERKYEILSVKADNVTISGFLLRNSGISSLIDIAGIKIYERKNVTIINNKLEGTFFGIYLQNATNCRVENNELAAYAASDQQSGNGIHCWKCDSLCIIGNSITRHRDGIYFEFVTNSVIWRNHSFDNIRYGLHFMFSHNDAYIANIFQNNSAGVSVMFTHGVKMFNNVFEDNWGDGCYGIFLKEISDSYIIGNRFLRNTTAIYAEGGTRIQMQKNSFIDNGWGLKIQASCQDVAVQNNNFIGNTFDVGTNGTLVLNTFNNNYWDKYEGYDLNRDGEGDVPYHPVSLYSMIVEKNPPAMILFRSFITTLMDKTEKVIPSLTPENLKDDHPLMKPLPL
ncbi:MAG TPA: nitrous oxide reductase family maturation protein NosD [Chitinophagaceae bacterium]|nr:nitrous oxide reductase family maturation protein NosD [Chitinophagaceae bacterium]